MDDLVNQQKALSAKEVERRQLKAQLVSITVRLQEAIEENAVREREITALNKARSTYQIKLCEINEEITHIRNSLSPLINRSIGFQATPGNLRYGGKTYLDFSLFKDDLDLEDSIPDADFFDALFITPTKKIVTPPRTTVETFEPPPDFQLTDLLPLGSKLDHKKHIEGVRRRLSLSSRNSFGLTAEGNGHNEVQHDLVEAAEAGGDTVGPPETTCSIVDSIKLKLRPLGEIARNSVGGWDVRQKIRKV